MPIKFNPCSPCCQDACFILHPGRWYEPFWRPGVYNHMTGGGDLFFVDYVGNIGPWNLTLNDISAAFFIGGPTWGTGDYPVMYGFSVDEFKEWLYAGNKKVFITTNLVSPDKGDTYNIPESVVTNINQFLRSINSSMSIATGVQNFNSPSYVTQTFATFGSNDGSPFNNMTPINPAAASHPLLNNVRFLYSSKAAEVTATGANCTYLDTTIHYKRGVPVPSGHWLAVETFGTSEVILCGDGPFYSDFDNDVGAEGDSFSSSCDNYSYIYANIYNQNFIVNLLKSVVMDCELRELPSGFNNRQQTLPYLSCYFDNSHSYFNIPWQVDRAEATCEGLASYTVWETNSAHETFNPVGTNYVFPKIRLYTIRDKIFSLIQLPTQTGILNDRYSAGGYHNYASGHGTITSGVPLIVNFSATTASPPAGHQWLLYTDKPGVIEYLPFRNLNELGAPIGTIINWRFEEPTADPIIHFNHPTQLSSVLEWGSGYRLMQFREGKLGYGLGRNNFADRFANINSRAFLYISGGNAVCGSSINGTMGVNQGYGVGGLGHIINLTNFFPYSCFRCEGADEFFRANWSGGLFIPNITQEGFNSIQIRDPRRCDPTANLPDFVWIECTSWKTESGSPVTCPPPNKVSGCLDGYANASWTSWDGSFPCSGCINNGLFTWSPLNFSIIDGTGYLSYCWCDPGDCSATFACAEAVGPATCNPVSWGPHWLYFCAVTSPCPIGPCSGLFTVYPV